MAENPYIPEYVTRMVAYKPGKPIAELERELGIKNAVKLASNENPLGPSPKAVEAMAKAAAGCHYYPDAAQHDLRHALAKKHGVDVDEIVVGNGSNELIDMICHTYVSPVDHAVFADPSFVCYRLGCTAANIPFDTVPMIDHVEYDIDALIAAVRPETRLLFLANPNNPTGAHVGRADLEKLLSAVHDKVLVVLDEAYVEFPSADDFVSALELRHLRDRLIVLRTFSKAYGLAGARVGYAVGPENEIDYLHRMRAPFNVNHVGQAAALAALEDEAHVARYVEMNTIERIKVREKLESLGLRVAPSEANFVLVNFEKPGAEVYDFFLRQGVILRPMPAPISTWLRITIGTSEQNEALFRAAEAWLAR